MNILARLESLERAVNRLQRAHSEGRRSEALQPNYLTVDPVSGAVGAVFPGGVQLPAPQDSTRIKSVGTISPSSAISWRRTSDGALVAVDDCWDNGINGDLTSSNPFRRIAVEPASAPGQYGNQATVELVAYHSGGSPPLTAIQVLQTNDTGSKINLIAGSVEKNLLQSPDGVTYTSDFAFNSLPSVCTFANGWQNYGGGWAPLSAFKLSSLIYVTGLITKPGGNFISNEVMFTLPAGYQPTYSHLYSQRMSGGGVEGDGSINVGNSVTLRQGAPANPVDWVAISFLFDTSS